VPPAGGVMVPPGTAPTAAEGPLANIAPGGAISPQFGFPAGPEPLPGIANPILVPVADDQLGWDHIVDGVCGYLLRAATGDGRSGLEPGPDRHAATIRRQFWAAPW
jgi:hypothetical protein